MQGKSGNGRVLMYRSSIVSTSGEVQSHPETYGNFFSLSSYDLGYIPFGANSTWACTIVSSSTDTDDDSTFGVFSDTVTPVFGTGLTSSFLAPKAYLNGSATYAVLAEIAGCDGRGISQCQVKLAVLLAFKFDGTNIPTPVFKPVVYSADIFPSKLKSSCFVEPNAFILMEDQYAFGSGIVTLAVACPRGPVLIDVTPVDGDNWLGYPTMQQRKCNPFGPASQSCDCTVNSQEHTIGCGQAN